MDYKKTDLSVNGTRPIIVVGMIRTGTKWLSNILANHSQIDSVQSVLHGGIIETNLFGQMEDWLGPLSDPESRFLFSIIWGETDVAKSCNVEMPFLQSLIDQSESYFEFYDRLMSWKAAQNQCRFWLQKTSAKFFDRIQNQAMNREAPVIVIRRSLDSTIKSTLQHRKNKRQMTSVSRLVCSFLSQERQLAEIERSYSKVMTVRYESLVSEIESVARRIAGFVGVEYEADMISPRYVANTSFLKNKKTQLSVKQKLEIMIARVVDLSMPEGLRKLLRSRMSKYETRLLNGTFRSSASNDGNVEK